MTVLDRNSPFVGRERELAVVAAQLQAATRGETAVVLIAGEPGIGKTRLLDHAIAGVPGAGDRVVWGRVHEGDPGAGEPVGAPAFWPWVQILRALLAQRDLVASCAERILPEQLASVAQLLPELRTLLPDLPPPPVLPPERARLYLFDAIAACVAHAARAGDEPLVLVLDDLQWADAGTLQLLEFIVGGPNDLPLLLLGAYRDVDLRPGRPLQRLLGELMRRSQVASLTLRPLAPDEVASVVEAATGMAPSEELVAALLRHTDGNPLFLTETLHLLVDEGRLTPVANFTGMETFAVPPSLRAVIERRLDRLSPECGHPLTLAAIVGREFDLGVLEAAGGSGDGALLDALEEAEEARIIAAVSAVPGRFRFTHALIAQTLAERLSRIRRIRLHVDVAEALTRYWGDVPEHFAELAYHFFQAAPSGCAAQAVTYARRAADHARTVLAFEEAARFWEMALQAMALTGEGVEAERCELLLALGEDRNRAGDIRPAKQAFREAAAIARRLGQWRALARAALGYGGDGFAPRLVDKTLHTLLDDALANLGEEDGALRARLLARRSQTLYWSGERSRQAALCEEAVALARRSGDAASWAYALAARCVTLRGPDRTEELVATASELVQLTKRVGDAEMRFWGHRWRLRGLLELGDIAAADGDIAALAGLAEELRQPYQRWYVTMVRASRALLTGGFDEAERLAHAAWEMGARVQKIEAEPYFVLQLCHLRWAQGRLDEIEAPLRQAVATGVPAWGALLAAVYSGWPARQDTARAEIERLAARGTAELPYGFPRDGEWLVALVYLAEACASLSDREHAARLYDLLLPYEQRNAASASTGPCHGAVARVLGRLAAVLGRWTAATQHFETALAFNTAMGAHPEATVTRYDWAAMLVDRVNTERDRSAAGRDDPCAARVLLDEALTVGGRLGMAPLVERATRLLDRLDARGGLPSPSRPPATVLPIAPFDAPPARLPDGLTARELEVLRLLAAGLSNPEIADRLVVSRKTVQQHTVNIYRKIRARGRTDAAAYAVRHGLASAPTEIE